MCAHTCFSCLYIQPFVFTSAVVCSFCEIYFLIVMSLGTLGSARCSITVYKFTVVSICWSVYNARILRVPLSFALWEQLASPVTMSIIHPCYIAMVIYITYDWFVLLLVITVMWIYVILFILCLISMKDKIIQPFILK